MSTSVNVVRQECPICGSGPIGLMYILDNQAIVPICDECESVWYKVDDIDEKDPLDLQGEPRVFPEIKITQARWASLNEIENKGLKELIIDRVDRPVRNFLAKL